MKLTNELQRNDLMFILMNLVAPMNDCQEKDTTKIGIISLKLVRNID